MKVFVALLALVGLVQALIPYDAVDESQFSYFKLTYKRIYKDFGEEQLRKEIFRNNLRLFELHNKRYAAGEVTYELGVNQFTDRLPSELQSLLLPYTKMPNITADFIFTPSNTENLPGNINWQDYGAVTPVKNQGQCGSCWAFSATGALEGRYFLKTQRLWTLSEQNLVDCVVSPDYSSFGCQGGWPSEALRYVQQNGGIDIEEWYPYKAVDQDCQFKKEGVGATVSGVAQVQMGSEKALAEALAEGPVSVAIAVNQDFFSHRHGVYNNPSCSDRTDHAVLVVGYGSDPSGGDYWLVKNSWDTTWGEQGYIRMARNQNNQCGIANYAIYPLV